MASLRAPKTLVLMALRVESQGLFEDAGIPVVYTGLGKTKAAFTATQVILQSAAHSDEKSVAHSNIQSAQRPDWIINLGTAGSRRFPVGTLVECTQFVQRDPFALLNKEIISVPAVTRLASATCGTADFIEFGEPPVPCDVMDMEAYSLAYVCRELGVRFTSVKYVSDTSDQNVVQDWKKNLKVSSEALLAQCLMMMGKA